MKAEEIVRELSGFRALESLSEEQLRGMAAVLRPTNYRSGSWLCRDGDEGSSCFFLLDGSLSVSKQLGDGRKVYLASLAPGQLLGQTGLVPGQKRTADVTASSDVQVLVLERRGMERGLSRGDVWATGLQYIIARHLVRQIRGALGRLEQLATQEDAESEALGRKFSDVAQPQALKMDFSSRSSSGDTGRAAAREIVRSACDEDDRDLPPLLEHQSPAEPAEVVVDDTREQLYKLLQTTEASMGSDVDYQLETVRVVVDDSPPPRHRRDRA